MYCTGFKQVSAVLLSASFVYDIFWVFVSPLIFDESIMIVVRTLIGRPNETFFCESLNFAHSFKPIDITHLLPI